MHGQFSRRHALAALAAATALPRQAGAAPRVDTDATGDMASVGLIARRGDGAVAAISGTAFGPAGERAFAADQPFRVASISKMLAATAFVALAMEKRVDLDSDASTLLGFRLRHPAHPTTPITPRMLLSHTSGLRNGPSYPVPLGRNLSEAFQPRGRHYDRGAWFGGAQHAPGRWFAYADVNYALVAQMLERLSGRRFDLYMAQSVFAPLGLDAGYNWSGVSDIGRARAAAGVRQVNGAWIPQVDGEVPAAPLVALSRAPEARKQEARHYKLGRNGFVFSPQGGLRLSLSGMDRLAQIYAAGGRWGERQLFPAEALAAIQTPQWLYDPAKPNGFTSTVFAGYGLGVQTPQGLPGPAGDAFFGRDSADWRGHTGDAYGWMTGLFWNIKDGRTLVWAVNGMPEANRPAGARSALTAPEEALVDLALGSK